MRKPRHDVRIGDVFKVFERVGANHQGLYGVVRKVAVTILDLDLYRSVDEPLFSEGEGESAPSLTIPLVPEGETRLHYFWHGERRITFSDTGSRDYNYLLTVDERNDG